MADVDKKKLRHGLTSKENRRLREAAKFLNELPINVEDDDDEDSEPRYLPEPDF